MSTTFILALLTIGLFGVVGWYTAYRLHLVISNLSSHLRSCEPLVDGKNQPLSHMATAIPVVGPGSSVGSAGHPRA